MKNYSRIKHTPELLASDPPSEPAALPEPTQSDKERHDRIYTQASKEVLDCVLHRKLSPCDQIRLTHLVAGLMFAKEGLK